MNCVRHSFFLLVLPDEAYASAGIAYSTTPPADRSAEIGPANPVWPSSPLKTILKLYNLPLKWKQIKTCGSLFCGIFEISSILAETENRLLKRSSTAGITKFDVRCAYFFCHVYVSKDTSFLSNRLICRLGAGFGSETWNRWANTPQGKPIDNSLSIISLSGAQYVGNLTYFAGVLCKQIIGIYCKSFSSTEILEKSDEGSTFITG